MGKTADLPPTTQTRGGGVRELRATVAADECFSTREKVRPGFDTTESRHLPFTHEGRGTHPRMQGPANPALRATKHDVAVERYCAGYTQTFQEPARASRPPGLGPTRSPGEWATRLAGANYFAMRGPEKPGDRLFFPVLVRARFLWFWSEFDPAAARSGFPQYHPAVG